MMTDRYEKNVETVRKISKIFGLKLLSFDPNWTFTESDERPRIALELISQSMLSSYRVPDDFMGKVATLMNLPWEFDTTTEHLEGLLKEFTNTLDNIGKNKPKLPDIIECKEEISRIQKMTDDLDRQVKEGTQRKIDHINSILNIRNGLKDYNHDKEVS